MKTELINKENMLNQRITQESVEGEVSPVVITKEAEDEDHIWIISFVMGALCLIMLGIVCCMCVYIKNQNRQKLNALSVQKRVENQIEAAKQNHMKGTPSGPGLAGPPAGIWEDPYTGQQAHGRSSQAADSSNIAMLANSAIDEKLAAGGSGLSRL